MNRSFQESDSDSAEDTTVSIKFVLLVRCRFMIFSKILDKAPNNCCAFIQIAYCRISDHVCLSCSLQFHALKFSKLIQRSDSL